MEVSYLGKHGNWEELVENRRGSEHQREWMEGGRTLASRESVGKGRGRTSVEWNLRSNSRNIWRLLEWGQERRRGRVCFTMCLGLRWVPGVAADWRLEIGAVWMDGMDGIDVM